MNHRTSRTGRARRAVDVFLEAAAEETPRPGRLERQYFLRCGADPEGVKKAWHAAAASRPVILWGRGWRYGRAGADLLAVAERLQIPIASSSSGLGAR